jgi:hypothetical protein
MTVVSRYRFLVIIKQSRRDGIEMTIASRSTENPIPPSAGLMEKILERENCCGH